MKAPPFIKALRPRHERKVHRDQLVYLAKNVIYFPGCTTPPIRPEPKRQPKPPVTRNANQAEDYGEIRRDALNRRAESKLRAAERAERRAALQAERKRKAEEAQRQNDPPDSA